MPQMKNPEEVKNMLVRRWEPFAELGRTHRAMDRLWREFDYNLYPIRDGSEWWSVPVDVVREGDSIAVRASVPGVKPDEIDVTIDDGVLTIKGETTAEEEKKETNYLMRERRTGSFYRALRLPDTVDVDKANSHYEGGVQENEASQGPCQREGESRRGRDKITPGEILPYERGPAPAGPRCLSTESAEDGGPGQANI